MQVVLYPYVDVDKVSSNQVPVHPQIAGWSSPVARRAHNPEVGGSNPSPATQKQNPLFGGFVFSLLSQTPIASMTFAWNSGLEA